MRIYRVTGKFVKDTVKFDLSIGLPQEDMNQALTSAKIEVAKAFGFVYKDMYHPETIIVTIQEVFE